MLLSLVLGSSRTVVAQNFGFDASVLMEAVSVSDPPSITLNWPLRADAQDYRLVRRDSAGVETTINLAGTTTGYSDTAVVVGQAYEYRIRATRVVGSNPLYAYGNIFCAIDLALPETQVSALLVVDAAVESALEAELTQWQRDVDASGYAVQRLSIPSGTAIGSLRNSLRDWADDQPAAAEKMVFLVGSLPVAYSGNIYPDGHPDHRGAWPTDGYLADLDGTWTDSTINNIAATRQQNWNVAGDGKFDQGTLPSAVELMVGRLDLSRLPAFAESETELLRRYLQKNHQFRNGRVAVARRGVIDDNFAASLTEGSSAASRFGMVASVGRGQVSDADFLSSTQNQPSLFGLAAGPGGYSAISGACSITDCVQAPPQVLFSLVFGSYFGDFDTSDNISRALLAADATTLAVAWTGRPQWQLHQLAMGYPLGSAVKLTQNTSNHAPYNMGLFARSVHVNLLGDPTLQLFPAQPLESATVEGSTVRWIGSPDPKRLGVHIYKRAGAGQSWIRQTTSIVAGNEWSDPNSAPNETYLVRAICRETTASGTFLNAAVGVVATPAETTVRIEAVDADAQEYPSKSAIVRVCRRAIGPPLTVTLAGPIGTAVEGADFAAVPRSVTIPEGELFVEMTIAAFSDTVAEDEESFALPLVPSGAYSIENGSSMANATIADHPYEAWCLQYFGEVPDVLASAPSADPDGDGVTNLLEFGLNTHPLKFSTAGLTPPNTTPTNECVTTYTRRIPLPGLTWRCEASSDLNIWTPNPIGWTETLVNENDTEQTIEIRVPMTSPQRFLRMRLETSPDFFGAP